MTSIAMLGRTAARIGKLAIESAFSQEPPRFLTHIVSFRCNARCEMCDSWRKPGGQEASLEEIATAYRRLGPLDGVRLTGGEPFVRTDLGEIAALAQEILKPLYLHVTTNGFLTDRILKFCAERDHEVPLHLMVSLDGLDEMHDRIRGRSWAFRRTWDTLEKLLPHRDAWNIRLSVNQTIVDRQGVAEAQRLRDRLAGVGIPHQVVLAYSDSATYSDDWDEAKATAQIGGFTPLAQLDATEIETLLAVMEAEEDRADFATRVSKRFYRKALAPHLRGTPTQPPPPCAALHRHVRLYPDGSVPVCQFNARLVGNLVTQDWKTISEGKDGREARAWVRACAGCQAECETLPSALYSGALLKEALRGG